MNNINPQQILQSIMGNSPVMQNPIARSAMELYQKGDINGLNELAQNLCRERGVDKNKLLEQIKSRFNF